MKRKFFLFLIPLLVLVLVFDFARVEPDGSIISLGSAATDTQLIAFLSQDIIDRPLEQHFEVRRCPNKLKQYEYWIRGLHSFDSLTYDRTQHILHYSKGTGLQFGLGGEWQVSDSEIPGLARMSDPWWYLNHTRS